MKHLILLSMIILGSLGVNAQYCIPSTGGYTDNFLTSVTTTGAVVNLDYSSATNPGVYTLLPTKVMAPKGTEFTLNLVANSLGEYSTSTVREDLRYCFAGIAIDWNQDQTFSDDEIELLAGNTPPTHNVGGNYNEVMNIVKTISIPANATGGEVRVRIFYSNAWLGASSFKSKVCGGLDKGIVYDFDLQIQGKSIVSFAQPSLGGSFVVKNGENPITSGAEIEMGAELTVETSLTDDSYAVRSIKVNGVEITGNKFVVSSTTTSIEVDIIQGRELKYSITGSGTLNVSDSNGAVASGAILTKGTQVTVKATPSSGYELTEIKINGTDYLSQATSPQGASITVNDNTVIVAKFEPIAYSFAYSFNSDKGSMSVTRNGSSLASGTRVDFDTELAVTLNPFTRCYVSSIKVNNVEKKDELLVNGNNFTYKVQEATTMDVLFDATKYTLTADVSDFGSVTMAVDGKVVNSGDEIAYGSLLEFEFSPNPDSQLEKLVINNENYLPFVEENYTDYTVDGDVTVEVVFRSPLSTPKVQLDQTLKAYFKGDQIIVEGIEQGTRIDVLDLTGKIVYTTTANSKSETIESSSKGSGVWLVKAVGDGGSGVRKIVK